MNTRGQKRVQTGVVTSTKMSKTITVKVERSLAHQRYLKYYRRSQKFLVHDAESSCREGDRVRIVECRPLSARKRWRLLEIVERKG